MLFEGDSLVRLFCMLKSVYFKKAVARISFLSKLWYFQYKSKQTVPQLWKKRDSRNCFLKMNGLKFYIYEVGKSLECALHWKTCLTHDAWFIICRSLSWCSHPQGGLYFDDVILHWAGLQDYGTKYKPPWSSHCPCRPTGWDGCKLFAAASKSQILN